MKISKIVVFFTLIFTTSTVFGQEKNSNIGFKGGANYGKYSPNKDLVDYNFQLGFYVGGFYKIQLDEKWQFQPELLLALQGSEVSTKENALTGFNGVPISNTATFDFDYNVYELTISIPLLLKLYIFDRFYLESGPQFGFVLNRKITSSQVLLDGNDNSFVKEDGDSFDFGVSLGVGHDISDDLSINLRAFSGLIKRDDDIKSFVINFGIEYNL